MIHSDKTSGEGENACFEGCDTKHIDNSKSLEEMARHKFYRTYPAAAVENLGRPRGHFEQLGMYCGMAFDIKEISALYSIDANNSLLVWRENCINELK